MCMASLARASSWPSWRRAPCSPRLGRPSTEGLALDHDFDAQGHQFMGMASGRWHGRATIGTLGKLPAHLCGQCRGCGHGRRRRRSPPSSALSPRRRHAAGSQPRAAVAVEHLDAEACVTSSIWAGSSSIRVISKPWAAQHARDDLPEAAIAEDDHTIIAMLVDFRVMRQIALCLFLGLGVQSRRHRAGRTGQQQAAV